jgi:hypothetical protein
MSRALKILETVIAGGRERVCEACGSEFICGVSLKGCWCSEIKLSDETRSKLRSQYSDCLCRQCLESVSVDQPAIEK